MQNKFIVPFIVLFSFIFSLQGCDSPLLNHSDENSRQNALLTKEPVAFFKSENLHVFADWLNGPQLANNNMIIELSEQDSKASLNDPSKVFYACLWMGIHGHGSLPVQTEQLAPGKYLLKNFEFIMPGPWELRLYLLDSLPLYDGLCDPQSEKEFDPSTIVELQEIKFEV